VRLPLYSDIAVPRSISDACRILSTVCAIASKFYPERPELHSQLTDMSRKLAFAVPAQGYKSVEIVQAYLLLALWGCGPVERYEQDRTWLLLGMAIRMATDLNLHRKTAVASADTAEGRARDREVHNRERTWYMCFVLDRSFSAQMGKPHSVKEDFIIRDAARWCRAPHAIPTDLGLAAYVHLQRLLARSLDLLGSGTNTSSGLQTDCDYYLVVRTLEAQITGWHHEWTTGLGDAHAGHPTEYWRSIAEFYTSYALLVINSFGLQNALERSPADLGHFFVRCHTTASRCATLVRDELGPLGYLKYSPDSHFVQCSYAVLTLLKVSRTRSSRRWLYVSDGRVPMQLIRPEFQPFLEQQESTIALVKDVADVLENIAAGPLHTPALYSALLKALISSKTEAASQPAGAQDAQPAPGAQASQTPGDEPPRSHDAMLCGASGSEYMFNSEMGPVQDISTFPPTMAPSSNQPPNDLLSMDTILSSGFWDSMIVPGACSHCRPPFRSPLTRACITGYSNTVDSLSGGFLYGAGGSGFITPRLGFSPAVSGNQTPAATSPEALRPDLQTLDAALADVKPPS
jgi:hypothetical protein